MQIEAPKENSNKRRIHELASTTSPELIIGLVGAIGTDLKAVGDALSHALTIEAAYSARTIRISQLLHEIQGLHDCTSPKDKHQYYEDHMKAGTELRHKAGASAMAQLAISAIRTQRVEMLSTEPIIQRRAFILHSLKRKEEIDELRNVYGPAFLLVSAYAPRAKRVDALARSIAESKGQGRSLDYRSEAEALVRKDEKEQKERLGQDVQAAFPEADAFIDATNAENMRNSTARFIRLAFGHPFHTPSRSEYGMFFAKAAAVRSSALGRQVGSAIATNDGDIIAVGTNDVPKASGGLYWEGDNPDGRDFVLGADSSDRRKFDLVSEILRKLKENGWLSANYATLDIPTLRKKALEKDASTTGPLRDSRIMDILEYMRPVHAEMAALMDAARRGISVQGHIMYVTTFPCHECARHLIASGLSKIIYIDPYPKSLTTELYEDSMTLEGSGVDSSTRVVFAPFVGLSPKRYMEFFELLGERKQKVDGTIIPWVPSEATLKYPGDYGTYSSLESSLLIRFGDAIQRAALSFRARSDDGGLNK